MGAHANPAIGRRLSLALLGSGAVAIMVYALTDSSAVDAALLLGSSALAPIALAAALCLHRPSFRLPWILFGAAQITWLFGWVFWERSVLAGGAPPDLDSPTHVLFVTAYPALFAALVLLVRAREPDSASWIDAGSSQLPC